MNLVSSQFADCDRVVAAKLYRILVVIRKRDMCNRDVVQVSRD